mmetsp:Transcript_14885/g.48558  ORF Transcript_14885/g.48558 Transcript_14885/m.48558 type:complete len:278 (-) Transcript_14885:262-1095(-)
MCIIYLPPALSTALSLALRPLPGARLGPVEAVEVGEAGDGEEAPDEGAEVDFAVALVLVEPGEEVVCAAAADAGLEEEEEAGVDGEEDLVEAVPELAGEHLVEEGGGADDEVSFCEGVQTGLRHEGGDAGDVGPGGVGEVGIEEAVLDAGAEMFDVEFHEPKGPMHVGRPARAQEAASRPETVLQRDAPPPDDVAVRLAVLPLERRVERAPQVPRHGMHEPRRRQIAQRERPKSLVLAMRVAELVTLHDQVHHGPHDVRLDEGLERHDRVRLEVGVP